MKLSEVKLLLEESRYNYELTIVPSRSEFYRSKGLYPTEDIGAFYVITIPNPNHKMDIQIIFMDDAEDSDFYNLEFGGYWFELFDCPEELLKDTLLNEIQDIINGRIYLIVGKDYQKDRWFFDHRFDDSLEEENNSMEAFYKNVKKINTPKNWWQKLTQKVYSYEIYNWYNYEKVVK